VGFGAGVTGGSLIAMLMNPFNKLMLSRYVTVASVPVYEIALAATMQIRGLIEATLRPLVPEVSRIGSDMTVAAGSRIAHLNRRAVRLVLAVGLPMYVVLMLFAPLLFHLWLGRQYTPSLPGVFRLMAIGGFASLVGLPAFCILVGTGRIASCFWGYAIPALFNVACVAAFVAVSGRLRIEYVACSFTAGTILSTLYLLRKGRQVYGAQPDSGAIGVCPAVEAGLAAGPVGAIGPQELPLWK
jgi:O-antigen/teichoic acid export membrane protein